MSSKLSRLLAPTAMLSITSSALAQPDPFWIMANWTGITGVLDPLLALFWLLFISMLDGFGWLF